MAVRPPDRERSMGAASRCLGAETVEEGGKEAWMLGFFRGILAPGGCEPWQMGDKMLLGAQRCFPLRGQGIGAVGLQNPGLLIIPEHGVQHGQNLTAQMLRQDGAGDLHPALGVPGHDIPGGNVQAAVFPLPEAIDPGVLQELAHQTADMDVLGLPGHAGQQAANAPHQHPVPGG